MPAKLERLETYLRGVDTHVISKDDDLVLPIIGNEGAGKSTLMLQMAWFWKRVRGDAPTPESVLDRMVWGEREAFKDALLESKPGDVIAVQDAPHVLHSKEAMHGDQIDVEKALLDVRIENYLILLGFQDWSDIPDTLRRRRAQNVIRVIKKGSHRGFYELFGRREIDEKYSDLDKNEWPDPQTKGRFPSLEGTDLWKQFNERDREEKRTRMDYSTEPEEDEQISVSEIADTVVDEGLATYLSWHGGHHKWTISTDRLYEAHDITHRQAKRVKDHIVERLGHDGIQEIGDEVKGRPVSP